MTRRPLLAVLTTVTAALALTACSAATTQDTAPSAGSGSSSAPASSSAGGDEAGTVTVLAAASLTEPFTTLAQQYEKDHPGVKIALSFGSSTTLAQQIAQGAPADVYASAGESALDQLPKDADQDGGRATIARNTVEIAVPPDNPGSISNLQDLANENLDVVLCADTVPCGAAADQVLQKAGVTPHVVSREVDVKATLTKVTLGEADAAMVYHSDVVSAGSDVKGVEIPASDNVTLTYPLLWFSQKPDVEGFAKYVAGPDGTAALEKAGFLAP